MGICNRSAHVSKCQLHDRSRTPLVHGHGTRLYGRTRIAKVLIVWVSTVEILAVLGRDGKACGAICLHRPGYFAFSLGETFGATLLTFWAKLVHLSKGQGEPSPFVLKEVQNIGWDKSLDEWGVASLMLGVEKTVRQVRDEGFNQSAGSPYGMTYRFCSVMLGREHEWCLPPRRARLGRL